MRLQSCFWTTLKMLLVAAFVAAGGSFSHSLAGTAHEHSHETAAASGGDIPHDHASNHSDHNVADHETVHCGAYLLVLTVDEHLASLTSSKTASVIPWCPMCPGCGRLIRLPRDRLLYPFEIA